MKNECLLKIVEEKELETEEFGFYWENFGQLMDQVKSECQEIEEALSKNNPTHLQEELGDLIHAAISLAVFCKFDPRETLQKSIEKFQLRYDAVKQMVKEEGRENLKGESFEAMMVYWRRAKLQVHGTLASENSESHYYKDNKKQEK